MIYLDSSALLKLVYEQQESAALQRWLEERAGTTMVTSELAKVEVIRACRRVGGGALPAARALLAELDLILLTGPVVDAAAETGPEVLRTLDALHLVSALSLAEHLVAFVAYDQRLLEAARSVGLTTVHPALPGQ